MRKYFCSISNALACKDILWGREQIGINSEKECMLLVDPRERERERERETMRYGCVWYWTKRLQKVETKKALFAYFAPKILLQVWAKIARAREREKCSLVFILVLQLMREKKWNKSGEEREREICLPQKDCFAKLMTVSNFYIFCHKTLSLLLPIFCSQDSFMLAMAPICHLPFGENI